MFHATCPHLRESNDLVVIVFIVVLVERKYFHPTVAIDVLNVYFSIYVGIYRFHCSRCCTLYFMLAELSSQEN